jgi:hypothetical protein
MDSAKRNDLNAAKSQSVDEKKDQRFQEREQGPSGISRIARMISVHRTEVRKKKKK